MMKTLYPVVACTVIMTSFFVLYHGIPKRREVKSYCLTKVIYNVTNITSVKQIAPPSSVVTGTQQPLYYVTQRPPVTFMYEPWIIRNDSCDNLECFASKEITWTMITFVKSSAGNFKRRALLRRTWASLRFIDGARFYVIFVIGETPDGKRSELLMEEHQRYGDILVFNGPDDYRNIAQKTLAGMSWAKKNLPMDFLYASADDDFLINLGGLKHDVDEAIKARTARKWPEMPILCGFVHGTKEGPMRNKAMKWYLAESMFRWTVFPHYCHGGFYVTSVDVARQIHEESRLLDPLPLDDVWITGILRHRIGMPDEMIYMAKSHPAHHFQGFHGKGSDSHRNFMSAEWKRIYDSFKSSSTVCAC